MHDIEKSDTTHDGYGCVAEIVKDRDCCGHAKTDCERFSLRASCDGASIWAATLRSDIAVFKFH